MEIIIGDCLTITEPDSVSYLNITKANAFPNPAHAEAKRYERSTRFINRYLTTQKTGYSFRGQTPGRLSITSGSPRACRNVKTCAWRF